MQYFREHRRAISKSDPWRELKAEREGSKLVIDLFESTFCSEADDPADKSDGASADVVTRVFPTPLEVIDAPGGDGKEAMLITDTIDTFRQQMFVDGLGSDCDVVVGPKKFKAHKAVLSQHSPVLAA